MHKYYFYISKYASGVWRIGRRTVLNTGRRWNAQLRDLIAIIGKGIDNDRMLSSIAVSIPYIA